MAKRNLKKSMLIVDFIVLLAIFFSVFVLFELVIKNILISYSVNKFHESMRTTQFDFSNSISYIEEKNELSYNDYVKEVFDYLKLSTLKRAKYDNSIIAIIFPEEENITIIGKRDDPEIKLDPKSIDYEYFKNTIIKEKDTSKKKIIEKNYVSFNFDGKQYIGIAKFSDIGIRKNFKRENNELVYPIFIIADRSDEFFYLINRVRNIFIILLLIVFVIGAFFKIYNTTIITKEILDISNRMTEVSNQINKNGIISGKLKEIITKFIETTNLDHSFLKLVKSLEALGGIITGIADKDLLVATLINDDSVLSPHDEMMEIIFLDIQGFTTISEKHKDDIMNIVNHIWIEVEGIIGNRYGKINKYEGDACLIIFRDADNKSNIHTALNAFYSGILMLEIVPKICKDLNIEFNFRVGIDYGKVIYGKTGTDNNFELGVIGDPVNTAARLEALSKQYHTNLLITDSAFVHTGLNIIDEYNPKNELQNDIKFKCIRIDKARPKGKTEAKEIYTVLKNKNDDYTFIGSEKYFSQKQFELYQTLVELFIQSITYWQKHQNYKTKYSIDDEDNKSQTLRLEAENYWSNLAKKFALFYLKTKFPPTEHFIKTILKFEEFDEFQKNPELWLKKERHRVKNPGKDWVKLGIIELSK